MLKLKLQYFGNPMRRANSFKRPWCCKRLKTEGKEGGRGWDGWMAPSAQRTWVWANSGRWWRTGKPAVLQSMRSQRVGRNWVTTRVTKTGYGAFLQPTLSTRVLGDSFWSVMGSRASKGLLPSIPVSATTFLELQTVDNVSPHASYPSLLYWCWGMERRGKCTI